MIDAGLPDSSPTEETPLRKNAEYVRWLSGEIMLSIGAGIGLFAFPLIALLVTGSASAAGLVGLLGGIGLVVGMLPGGVMTDRYDRKRLVIIGGLLGLAVKGLFIAVLLFGDADMWTLGAIAFIDQLRGALFEPASTAMLRQIVSRKQLPTAVSVNQGRDAAVELGSGPAGGALLGLGIAFPVVAQLIGHVGSLIMTLLLRDGYRPNPSGQAKTHPLADVRDGASWMIRQPVRLQLGIAAALVNLGISGVILAVTLSLAQQGVDPAIIGLLSSVLALSLLVGSVVAPKLVRAVPTGVLAVGELLVIAVGASLIPMMPNMWWIAAIYAVMGLGIAPLNAGVMGYFTLITPNRLLGRVGAFMGLLSMGLTPIAPAVAGWGLDHLGDVGTMSIFAGICVVAAAVAALSPGVRSIPNSECWEAHASEHGLLPED